MNLLLYTQANKKGQVVIPKIVRDKLGIEEGTRLRVVMRDQGLYLYPAQPETPFSKENYLKVLRTTRGAWGSATAAEIEVESEKHKLEQKATERNKKAW